LEQLELQYPDAIRIEHLDVEWGERNFQVLELRKFMQRVARVVSMDRLGHRQPVESLAQLDRLPLIGDRGGTEYLLRNLAKERLGEILQITVIAIRLEKLAHRLNDSRALDEDVARDGIGDEIEVTLSIFLFGIDQAVEFFGQWPQRLRQQSDRVAFHRQLAGFRLEQRAGRADDVAQVPM